MLIPAVFQVGFMLYPSQFPAVFHVGSGCVLHGLGLRPILIPAHIYVPYSFQLCSRLVPAVFHVGPDCVLRGLGLCPVLIPAVFQVAFMLCPL